MPSQLQLFYRAHRDIADGNLLFLEMVHDGMTREDLARNIERRPQLWSRFSHWLARLPSAKPMDRP
ncbi:hypothetical protein [Thiomonas sp.]